MECKEDEFISVMRVNLFASYWMLKEFLPAMLSRNHGHIVSVVGSAGLFGFCHMFDNCTSKFAIIGMMESLDHELTLGRQENDFLRKYIFNNVIYLFVTSNKLVMMV